MIREIEIRKYRFDKLHYSGSSFADLQDTKTNTLFASTYETSFWDKNPNIGDIIEIEVSDCSQRYNLRVWINSELVYTRDEELEAKRKKEWDDAIEKKWQKFINSK